MNFFEAQDFFKKMYPEILVSFEFDEKCMRTMEIIHTDGQVNPVHHIEYNKVKVTPLGSDSIYVPIAPHRMNVEWEQAKAHLNKMQVLK